MFKRFLILLIVIMMVFPVIVLAADVTADLTLKQWAVANIELLLGALFAFLVPITCSLIVSFTKTPPETADQWVRTAYSWLEKAAIMWFRAKDTGGTK